MGITVLMVSQGLENAARCDPTASTLANHLAQLLAETLKPFDFRLNRRKVPRSDRIDIAAFARRVFGEINKRAHVGQLKAKATSVADEGQAFSVTR